MLWAWIKSKKVKRRIVLLLTFLFFVAYWKCLPSELFKDPYSTVLLANNKGLLSATIANDGQWRFPADTAVSEKFTVALTAFEDKRFYSHPGVDVLSLFRAFRQNISAGKIVSGGSTISMQVIRLSRRNKNRSILEKAIEVILATRLELKYSKEEILALYASHAPFGGNVVGVQAACWRYFGTDALDLSWGQACMLAVLPNSPSLMHPGKNRDALKRKRDRLIDKLHQFGMIDAMTANLAKAENIPDQPQPLPRHARHLLLRLANDGRSEKITKSTIDLNLQLHTERVVGRHHERLMGNGIYNAAAIVLDVKSGNVIAYVGNIDTPGFHESEVDIISSRRSTGSILKPFLYAAMMDEGKLLPTMLLSDAPFIVKGFSPKNFSLTYDGAVHADEALVRSLNVPAVHLLKDYRYEKFYKLLKDIGATTLNNGADHYSLSLILGGAEATLWDISGMYASVARLLGNYFQHPGKNKYNVDNFHEPSYVQTERTLSDDLEESTHISAASAYLTFEALKELKRPGEESGWRQFSSSRKIAWKTGTSFGFRDGWAVGVTPDYVVGVWVGNADGEGRPGLTGTDAAAPLMFDILSFLPGQQWFRAPLPEMTKVRICRNSGHRAGEFCSQVDTLLINRAGLRSNPCPYHKRVHLSVDSKYQVNDQCAAVYSMRHVNWFVLPPVQEYYFKKNNLTYKTLPAFAPGCEAQENISFMEMVYPKHNARIFIPKEIDGQSGKTVFELAHRDPSSSVFWHLDGQFMGITKKVHTLALMPSEGRHTLTVVDENGKMIERQFDVISSTGDLN